MVSIIFPQHRSVRSTSLCASFQHLCGTKLRSIQDSQRHFALNYSLYYYSVYCIFLSTYEFDRTLLERFVGIEARIKHEKEMEKDRQEFKIKREKLQMSHENNHSSAK